MSQQVIAPQTPPHVATPTGWKSWLSLENRFVPPVFITLILLVGHLSFGMLESYQKTLLAIVVSMLAELVLGRIFLGKWPHLASAYITGISVGILLRSPAFWPFASVQPDLHHLEICSAREGPPYLEPFQFRRLCSSFSGGRHRREPKHSMGKFPAANDRHLGFGGGDYLAAAAFPYHWDLC